MADLATRICDFVNSLGEFKKLEHYPSWQSGQLFNSLLAEAKEALPDDRHIKGIEPAEKGITGPGVMGKEIAKMDVGTMKAVMTQVLSALDQTGPAASFTTLQ
jgi:hypothetical protein